MSIFLNAPHSCTELLLLFACLLLLVFLGGGGGRFLGCFFFVCVQDRKCSLRITFRLSALYVPIINTSSAVVRWELNSKLLTNQMEPVQSSQQQQQHHQCVSVRVCVAA